MHPHEKWLHVWWCRPKCMVQWHTCKAWKMWCTTTSMRGVVTMCPALRAVRCVRPCVASCVLAFSWWYCCVCLSPLSSTLLVLLRCWLVLLKEQCLLTWYVILKHCSHHSHSPIFQSHPHAPLFMVFPVPHKRYSYMLQAGPYINKLRFDLDASGYYYHSHSSSSHLPNIC